MLFTHTLSADVIFIVTTSYYSSSFLAMIYLPFHFFLICHHSPHLLVLIVLQLLLLRNLYRYTVVKEHMLISLFPNWTPCFSSHYFAQKASVLILLTLFPAMFPMSFFFFFYIGKNNFIKTRLLHEKYMAA